MTAAASIDLFWLPLGAGGQSVRWNGRAYEVAAALHDHRHPADLYHSALELRLGPARWVVEMAPVWNISDRERGPVCVGPVGSRRLGRFRAFQYEVRCWRDGRIPDIDWAVGDPQRLCDQAVHVATALACIHEVPVPTWGRDELRCGEMWNSNSVVSWLLTVTGHAASDLRPPRGGRAPGWTAGVITARRRLALGEMGQQNRRQPSGPRGRPGEPGIGQRRPVRPPGR